MTQQNIYRIALLALLPTGLLFAAAAPTPTPTPTPKKNIFSWIKASGSNSSPTPKQKEAPTAKPKASATPKPKASPTPKSNASATPKPKNSPSAKPTPREPTTAPGVGRGISLGREHPSPTPTPSPNKAKKTTFTPTPTPKSKKSTPTPSPVSHKTATPSPTPSPAKSPKKESAKGKATPAKAAPTPTPFATPETEQSESAASPARDQEPTSAVIVPEPQLTGSVKPSAEISTKPAASKIAPGAIEITLIKFVPMQGSPDQPGYQNARLSYRINVGGPKKVEFPVIDFSVESAAGKVFERHFELPAGNDFLEPGPDIDRTVALDPSPNEDWASVYQKTDKAKFTWSIKGKSNGSVDGSVHQAWP